MRVMRVLGSALGTLRIIETVKEYSPVIPPPAVKSSVAVAVAAGLSVLQGERALHVVVVEAAAAAGLASVLHDAQEAAKRYTDNQIASVLRGAPRRTAPLGG